MTLAHSQGKAVLALVVGICLPLLDTTIVSVALPDLAKAFGVGIAPLQWLATSYTLAAACTVPISAWATRRYGSRTMWLFGLWVFGAGSALIGSSSTLFAMILFRMVQGIGTGILTPVMQSALVHAVGRDKLKTAMATAAVPAVIAPIAGPFMGGLLLSIGTWHLIFFINVPIVLLAIALAAWALPKNESTSSERFDLSGFILLLPGLGALIWALSSFAEGSVAFGEVAAYEMLGAGAFFTLFFCLHVLRRTDTPLLDLRLFSIPTFRASIRLLFLSSIAFYGGIFVLPLLLSHKTGMTDLQIALMVGVHGLGALVSRPALQTLTRWFGNRNSAFGAIAVTVAGTIPLLVPDLYAHPFSLACVLVSRGAGVGFLTLLAMSNAFHDVERSKVPDASSLSRVFTLIGASIGTAAISTLHGVAIRVGYDEFSLVLLGLTFVALVCAWGAESLDSSRG